MLVRNIVQLSYGIFGISCYFLVFWTLFALRNSLSKSCIVIFVLMATSNIVTWLNSWIYLKLNIEPFFFFYYEWLSERPVLMQDNAQNFLVSHFNYVQNVDLLLLTIDRYAAIASIAKNIYWWNRHYIFIIVAVHSVVIAGHLAIRLPMANTIKVNSSTRSVQFGRDSSDYFRNALDANARLIFGVAIFLACSILNILSLMIIRRLKVTKTTSIQRSFFFISLCIFVTQAMNVFIACLIALFNTLGPDYNTGLMVAYEMTTYFSDLFSLGPPVYTILMPGLVRQHLIRKIKEVLRMNSEDHSQVSTVEIK